MKHFLSVLLVICMFLAVSTGCSESSDSSSPGSKSTKVIEAPVREAKAPAAPLMDSGELGQYEVSIGELEFVQDYTGAPAILIHFTFTNNSEENKSAVFTLDCQAFQNGIGLKNATTMDDSVHKSEDLMKEIQPGATIELTEAYLLSSDTAPVEFYITEAISFDDTKLGKIFEISPGGTTVLSIAPGVDSAVEISKYRVSINSYNIAEDYEGNSSLILNMGYTNDSNDTTPFYVALEISAFQDGIELEEAFFVDNSAINTDNNYLNVLPGAGLAVAEAFVLTSDTSPVEIEIAELFSFSDEKIATTIDITE